MLQLDARSTNTQVVNNWTLTTVLHIGPKWRPQHKLDWPQQKAIYLIIIL